MMLSEKLNKLKKVIYGLLLFLKSEKIYKIMYYLGRYILCNIRNDIYQIQVSCYLMGGKNKKGVLIYLEYFCFLKFLRLICGNDLFSLVCIFNFINVIFVVVLLFFVFFRRLFVVFFVLEFKK